MIDVGGLSSRSLSDCYPRMQRQWASRRTQKMSLKGTRSLPRVLLTTLASEAVSYPMIW
jgi:hypothetical protein